MYIENIFVCVAAPMLVAAICCGREQRSFYIFTLAGEGMCLLSAYISTFFAGLYDTETALAAIEITPVVEEAMKLLPLLFYILVFEPERKKARNATLIIASTFAVFENICWLVEHGSGDLTYILLRGFGTGVMHIVCGIVVGYGLLFIWDYPWLKAAGTFGLLCMAITYHAIYNVLLYAGGTAQNIGFALPLVTAFAGIIIVRRVRETAR